jgi:hypothetical protein
VIEEVCVEEAETVSIGKAYQKREPHRALSDTHLSKQVQHTDPPEILLTIHVL